MKRVHHIFALLILTATLLISCDKTKEIASSDDIGTYAFSLLSNLENTSEQAYINNMYTYEELRSYTEKNADSIENDFKENIAVVTKKNFNARIIKDYKDLKEKGTSLNIEWNAIEPITFKYLPRAKHGVKSIKGDLFFTHNKIPYKVTVTALDAGNSYFITKIEGLAKVVDQK